MSLSSKRTGRNTARQMMSRFRPAVDGLERREVLSAAAAALPAAAVAPAAAPITQIPQQLLTDVHFAINNLNLNHITSTAASGVATGTLTANLLGHPVSIPNLQIPISLSPGTTGTAAATTQILHLSLGPVNLNLLGLNVDLDNCAGGPITVDVSATSGSGKLLGNLLTDLSNLLNNPTGSLSSSSVGTVTGILNGVLGALTSSTPASPTGGGAGAATPGVTDTPGNILSLHLAPIDLSLLGLNVDTSAICLNVSAVPGNGNLLGNLLSGVTHLLDNPGNPVGGILAHLNQASNLLDQLAG